METMPGISLYSCLYLKIAKTPCLSYYLLCFLFNKIREQEGGTGSAWKPWWGLVAQTMYIHVSKGKNNKIKGEKNLKRKQTSSSIKTQSNNNKIVL
jgi:hypothetical protein